MKNEFLIKPGDVVLDYATRLPVGLLKSLNVKMVMRYISHTDSWKCITKDESDELHAAGIAWLPIFEWSSTRANSGAPGGTEDALRTAYVLKNTFNFPQTLPVSFAIDTNTTTANSWAHRAYSEAFDSTIEAQGYPLAGIYGDNDIIAYCIIHNITVLNWRAGARYWSNYQPPVPGCHVSQIISGSTTSYDNNEVLLPFYAWLPHTPIGDEVEVITNEEARDYKGVTYGPGIIKWVCGLRKRHLEEGEWIKVYQSRTGIPLTNAELDAIPNEEDLQPVGPQSFTFTGQFTGKTD